MIKLSQYRLIRLGDAKRQTRAVDPIGELEPTGGFRYS